MLDRGTGQYLEVIDLTSNYCQNKRGGFPKVLDIYPFSHSGLTMEERDLPPSV